MKYTIQNTNFIDWYTSGGSDDPKTVITQWFDAGGKILPVLPSLQEAEKMRMSFILWASEHLEEIRKEHEKGCCYKWKFIEDCIQRGVRTRCQDFLGEGTAYPHLLWVDARDYGYFL